MKVENTKAFLASLVDSGGKKNLSLSAEAREAATVLLAMLAPFSEQQLSELKVVNRRENLGSLLMKFAELSKFGKGEWIELAKSYEIELSLNPRDSARDVMGKLARHLRDNPLALEKMSKMAGPVVSRASKPMKRKRVLAENLQDTLERLLEE
jgi:hypothetical protein